MASESDKSSLTNSGSGVLGKVFLIKSLNSCNLSSLLPTKTNWHPNSANLWAMAYPIPNKENKLYIHCIYVRLIFVNCI